MGDVMFIKFSEEVQHLIKNAKLEMQEMNHPFVGSEHLLLSILKHNNYVSDILNRHHVNYDIFKKTLLKMVGVGRKKNKYFIYTPLLKRVIEEAILDTKENNNKEVDLNTLFLAILNEGEGVAIRILNSLDVDIDKLYDEFSKKEIKSYPKKLLLNECGIDLCKKAMEKEFDPLIGREREVEDLIEIICRRNKCNPLLIGEAGVGKTAIVEELAKRIVNNNVPDKIKNMRIVSLSMGNLVSGTKYRGEFEDRVTKIIKELENNPEIILFIDEIHTLVGAGGAEGAIDASNLIKPALARGKIKVIGATTINEYKDSISKDKALNRRFQTIMIKENTDIETKTILYNLKTIYEEYHHVKISNTIIDQIVELSNKYLIDKKNPDKALDILDTVCTSVSLKNNIYHSKLDKIKIELNKVIREKNSLIVKHHFNEATILRDKEIELESSLNAINKHRNRRRSITIKDVSAVIEKKTGIPIYEVNNNLKKIRGLSKYLKDRIIGQDSVIDNLVTITNKVFCGLKNELPYSMLFIGKSGVGKTMLVKEYSKYLNIPLIRLDMGEYKETHTVSKIIGSPPGYIGYNEYNNVLEKVKNNPFSILLLDEIEKANSEVLNVFLSILDEGIIMDSHGNKVDFRNTIIIMTSNIGSEHNLIGFNNNIDKESDIRKNLSTIFVNRINRIIYFNELTIDNVREIIKNKITDIKKKYHKNGITIDINSIIIDELVNESNYAIYGVRHINRLIEDKMDNLAINSILNNKKRIKIS